MIAFVETAFNILRLLDLRFGYPFENHGDAGFVSDPFFRQHCPGADRQIVVNGQRIAAQVLQCPGGHRVAHFQIVAFQNLSVFIVEFSLVDAADEVIVGTGFFAFEGNKMQETGQSGTAGF